MQVIKYVVCAENTEDTYIAYYTNYAEALADYKELTEQVGFERHNCCIAEIIK